MSVVAEQFESEGAAVERFGGVWIGGDGEADGFAEVGRGGLPDLGIRVANILIGSGVAAQNLLLERKLVYSV
ncbi:MAG: hypothetical protein ABI383_03450, partial [Acidobacteriaceae bacterium]